MSVCQSQVQRGDRALFQFRKCTPGNPFALCCMHAILCTCVNTVPMHACEQPSQQHVFPRLHHSLEAQHTCARGQHVHLPEQAPQGLPQW